MLWYNLQSCHTYSWKAEKKDFIGMCAQLSHAVVNNASILHLEKKDATEVRTFAAYSAR